MKLTLFLLALPLLAQDHPATALRISQAALLTGQTLDIASNWHGAEANPLMRSGAGTFGAKGLSIKLGVTAGLIAVEGPLVRKWPRSRLVWTALNWGAAAGATGIAIGNWRVGR